MHFLHIWVRIILFRFKIHFSFLGCHSKGQWCDHYWKFPKDYDQRVDNTDAQRSSRHFIRQCAIKNRGTKGFERSYWLKREVWDQHWGRRNSSTQESRISWASCANSSIPAQASPRGGQATSTRASDSTKSPSWRPFGQLHASQSFEYLRERLVHQG